MNATHTPGPWKANRGIDDEPKRCFVAQAIDPQRPWIIAVIHNGAPGDCLETEFANASLIAAAPSLLDALREMVALYDDIGRSSLGRSVREKLARAESAIAKAEGGVA